MLLADLDPFGQPNACFLELSPNRRTQRVERRAQQAIEGQSDPVVDHVFFVRLLDVLVLQALARQQAGQMLEELLHREPAVGVYRLDFQREELLFLEGRAAEGVVEDVPVPVRQHAPLDPCRAEVGGELLDAVCLLPGERCCVSSPRRDTSNRTRGGVGQSRRPKGRGRSCRGCDSSGAKRAGASTGAVERDSSRHGARRAPASLPGSRVRSLIDLDPARNVMHSDAIRCRPTRNDARHESISTTSEPERAADYRQPIRAKSCRTHRARGKA